MASILWEILKCIGFTEDNNGCVLILPSYSGTENQHVSDYFIELFPSSYTN